ncbi:MAG TPA: response regulator transcription factor [Azospirillum sp.]|nr:response regulator transcription factor [Azospirillum sp.]
MRVLLVEPNDLIAEAFGRQLKNAKIQYARVDAGEVWDLLKGSDGFAADDAVMVGGIPNPVECIALLRRHAVKAPILHVIDRRCTATTVAVLQAGADDVLVKPVVSSEIRARIEARRRRTHGLASNAVVVGRMTVFLDGRDPEIDGVPLRLSRREHAILSVLALHHRRVVSKEHVYESVYGPSDSKPLDKVIDVYLCKLRKKIADATGGGCYIETVYGRGFKLEAPDVAVTAREAPVSPREGFCTARSAPIG